MIPAASVLDRRTTALVLIDIQDRLAAAMPARDAVVSRTGFLVQVARIVGVPVVVTRQYPKGLGDTDGAIAAALALQEADRDGGHPDTIVDKMTFDCFCEPSFVSAVSETGARQLLVAGMETHICVTQTALAALREGLDVHVCADACASRDEEMHRLALARLAHAGAVVTCAESAAYELVGRAGTPEFKALLAAVKG